MVSMDRDPGDILIIINCDWWGVNGLCGSQGYSGHAGWWLVTLISLEVGLTTNPHLHDWITGVGSWKWGTKIRFFRFPEEDETSNPVGNSAANTQTLIELLDTVDDVDSFAIKSYLRGGTGFREFRKLVTNCLCDPRIVSVLWADLPEEAINLESSAVKPSVEDCHAVRSQMLKMLKVGAIQWPGFTPPHIFVTTMSESAAATTATATLSSPSAVNTTIMPSPSSRVPVHDKATQTDPTGPEPPIPHVVDQQHRHTQTTVGHLEALSGTYSAGDQRKDACIHGLARLRKVTPPGFHWTSLMITVLLRFVYYAVVHLNWSWHASSDCASEIFNVRIQTVKKFGTLHLQSPEDVVLPPELSLMVRGRGSIKFKANDVDERFKIIKENHLKRILIFVRERNRSMAGMCTVRSIQAHLLQKFGVLFKYPTVRYALAVRLGLKYRTTRGTRIVFTPQRIHLADNFCVKIVKGLEEEAAGTAVMVYEDETYCHQHHMPAKAWQEDEDVTEAVSCDRVRSRGKMMIIIHALTKFGLVFKRNRHGVRPEPDEWQGGRVLNCEMIFQSKKALGDYHENMNDTMFLKWLRNRLIPTFKALYGRKKLILVLDNAPYHHVNPEDSFFAHSRTKEDIKAFLQRPNVNKKTIKVNPYEGEEQQKDPPSNLPGTPWADYEQWVIIESTTGLAYYIDGMSDQGFGEVIVYVRVTAKKMGAVESTMVEDFRRLLTDDFQLIGRGPAAIRYVRTILGPGNKVPRNKRTRGDYLRRKCTEYTIRSRDIRFTYRTESICEKYNGSGFKGTGGPKLEWLRPAVDAFIDEHHPRLHMTKVCVCVCVGG